MLRIDIVLKAIKFYSFSPPPPPHFYCVPPPPPPSQFYSFPPPPPPPSHFYCFPSTTATTTFLFFSSTTVNKRLQTTIISSVCRIVSSCQEQSWFYSILSCLSSSSATVSFTDSQSTATTVEPRYFELV